MVFKELVYDMNWHKEEWRGGKILMSKKGYGLFCIPHMSIMWVLRCISVCILRHESTLYPPSPVALFSPFCTSASWTISVEERIILYVLQRQQVALSYTQCRNHESLQIWALISQKMNPVTTYMLLYMKMFRLRCNTEDWSTVRFNQHISASWISFCCTSITVFYSCIYSLNSMLYAIVFISLFSFTP